MVDVSAFNALALLFNNRKGICTVRNLLKLCLSVLSLLWGQVPAHLR